MKSQSERRLNDGVDGTQIPKFSTLVELYSAAAIIGVVLLVGSVQLSAHEKITAPQAEAWAATIVETALIVNKHNPEDARCTLEGKIVKCIVLVQDLDGSVFTECDIDSWSCKFLRFEERQ